MIIRPPLPSIRIPIVYLATWISVKNWTTEMTAPKHRNQWSQRDHRQPVRPPPRATRGRRPQTTAAIHNGRDGNSDRAAARRPAPSPRPPSETRVPPDFNLAPRAGDGDRRPPATELPAAARRLVTLPTRNLRRRDRAPRPAHHRPVHTGPSGPAHTVIGSGPTSSTAAALPPMVTPKLRQSRHRPVTFLTKSVPMFRPRCSADSNRA